MFINPHLILDLHATRVADLRAEAAHDHLVRALRRHASTADIDRGVPRGARPPVVAAAAAAEVTVVQETAGVRRLSGAPGGLAGSP